MTKIIHRTLVGVSFLVTATFVVAQESRIEGCLKSVEQGDFVSAALDIALMSLTGGDEHLTCQQALDEHNSTSDEMADQAKRQSQLREKANNRLIDRDVLAACTELFAEQKTAAMTNSVCVTAFRQLGHPDLDR